MPNFPICSYTFSIPQTTIDENCHVNNVANVQWMQEVAVRHYESSGGTNPMQEAGVTWGVREHRIEYLLPAFAGEEIDVRTWVENIRKVRSLRRYEIIRKSDGELLAKGETEWVFVDAKSGRAVAIPGAVVKIFTFLSE